MSQSRERFWADYYGKLSLRDEPWLDYSNERVQSQTFGVAFAALGPVSRRRCLDVGCGYGQLARALHATGAREVVGIDVTTEFVVELRRRHPELRWEVGTLEERDLCERIGSFDLITLVEVLQFVPLATTLRRAWSLLEPGGRLVAVVPNRDCPIVARAMARFGADPGPAAPGDLDEAAPLYLPPSAAELIEIGRSLEDNQGWGLQAMFFAADQTLVPYAVSGWTTTEEFATPPNRLVFAAEKAREEGPASSGVSTHGALLHRSDRHG
jgi:SAM-dependent methyltransferase